MKRIRHVLFLILCMVCISVIDSDIKVKADGEPPITNIITPSSGSYKAGDSLIFQVTFSESVVITGTPRIHIDVGGITVYAQYISGTGTSTIIFTYIIQDGQTDTDGISIGSAIDLNSGTIKSEISHVDAVLGFTSPVTTGIIIDTTAPNAPLNLVLTAATDTGLSNADNITNNNTPTFTGTVEANANVKLYSGATEVGSGTTDGSGNWSVTINELTDGDHTITAKAFDLAGNGSVASTTLSITIDTIAPAPPSYYIDEDTGISNNDRITNDHSITIYGTCDPLCKLGNGSIIVSPNGNWSLPVEVSFDAELTLTLFTTDIAGNKSTIIEDNFFINITPPTVNGVTEGSTYASAISPSYSDIYGAAATLKKGTDTAVNYTSGTEISVNGSYILTVTDTAGNVKIVSFTVDIPSIPSTGSYTDTTQSDVRLPAMKGANNKAGWEAMTEEIRQMQEGDVITIEMNGSMIVPREAFSDIKGRNLSLVFDMGDGILWSINGQSITDDTMEYINLGIRMDTQAIPEDLLQGVAKEQAYRIFSLSHDGEFGLLAALSINMEEQNAGRYAYLYYYNPTSKILELQSIRRINERGYADFMLKHASDYVVVINNEQMVTEALDQITINATKGNLYIGGTQDESMKLELELPALLKEMVKNDSSQFTISYQSVNPKVATVTEDGEIIAKKAGRTTITTVVTIGGVRKRFRTTITISKAQIKLEKSVNIIKKGETFTYKAKGYGVSTEEIKYYTSKKSIVVINKITGKAVAKTTGIDYVTAKVGNVKVQIKVEVR